MLITCPNCQTAYEVEEGKLRPAGRSVRCAHCGELWLAKPPVPVPLGPRTEEPASKAAEAEPEVDPVSSWSAPAEEAKQPAPALRGSDESARPALAAFHPRALPAAPMLVAPPLIEGEAEPARALTAPVERGCGPDETLAARPAPTPGRGPPARVGTVLAGSIAAMLAVLAALVLGRSTVVRATPQTARIYAAIGLPVNLRGLAFEGVRLGFEMADGVPVMVIDGSIANKSKHEMEVPRLRFAVRNADRLETYAWTALPALPVLGAGESLPFRTRLAAPPPDAQDVLVRFYHRRDLAAGG